MSRGYSSEGGVCHGQPTPPVTEGQIAPPPASAVETHQSSRPSRRVSDPLSSHAAPATAAMYPVNDRGGLDRIVAQPRWRYTRRRWLRGPDRTHRYSMCGLLARLRSDAKNGCIRITARRAAGTRRCVALGGGRIWLHTTAHLLQGARDDLMGSSAICVRCSQTLHGQCQWAVQVPVCVS